MSELFTSSSDKPANTAIATATPPYSSEGPTIPVIGTLQDPNPGHNPDRIFGTEKSARKRKDQGQPATKRGPQPRPPHTLHPALYAPWTLLPPELSKLLKTQARLRTAAHHANIVPVVFSKNQNIKAGINKLKTYLGARGDAKSSIEIPDALCHEDGVIAVSAQGEGAGKLVGIVDMVRRIVGAGGAAGPETQTWYLYTMLASVEVERTAKVDRNRGKGGVQATKTGDENQEEEEEEEEEAFETMEVDREERVETQNKTRKVPVLTIWMTRVRILAFSKEFGEQILVVKKAVEEGG